MEIACEMQVHIFHRHDLRIAAPGSATLHPEIRTERGFANTDHRLFTNAVQTIAKTNSRRRLTFACWRWVDGGDQDQLAIFAVLNRIDERLADFGLIMPVRQKVFALDPNLSANVLNQGF